MAKVMVRVPTHGPIDRGLADWFHWAGKNHPEWDLAYYYQTAGVCETRNEIVGLFLASDCDKLWMIDSDVTPPESDEILKVVGKDGQFPPVVVGLYGHYHPQVGANFQVYKKNTEVGEKAYKFYAQSEWPDDDVTFTADAAGTGCMVMTREILEEIQEQGKLWFVFDYIEGRRIGEDFTFCEKAGGVTVLPSFVCTHAREVNLTELVRLTQFAAIGVQAMKEKREQGGSMEGVMSVADVTIDEAREMYDMPPKPEPLAEIIAPNRATRRRRNRKKRSDKP